MNEGGEEQGEGGWRDGQERERNLLITELIKTFLLR